MTDPAKAQDERQCMRWNQWQKTSSKYTRWILPSFNFNNMRSVNATKLDISSGQNSSKVVNKTNTGSDTNFMLHSIFKVLFPSAAKQQLEKTKDNNFHTKNVQ